MMSRIDRKAVGVFLAVTFGAAWALELVLTLTGGLTTPWAAVGLVVVMFAPMLGSWVTCRFVTHQPWAASIGLRRDAHGTLGLRRVAGFGALAVALVLLVALAAMALAIAVGWLTWDPRLPGLDATLGRIPAAKRPPAWVLGLSPLVQVPIAAFTINGFLALGEEAGWRGWLLGALLPLGRMRAVLLVGLLWGLWHAPLIMMGYEYQHQVPAVVGIALFCVFCMALGTVLAWLRLRTGSVVTSAIGHGAINAVATWPVMLVPAAQLRWPLAAINGVSGLVVLAVVAVALLARGRWSVPDAMPAPAVAPSVLPAHV